MDRPEAGWYPDPERPGKARYFDGTRWTDEVRAAAPSAPTDQGLPPGEQPQASTGVGSGNRAHDEGPGPADGPAGSDERSSTSGRAPTTAPLPAAAATTAGGSGAAGSAGSRTLLIVVSVVLMVVVLGGTFFFAGLLGGASEDGEDGAGAADETDTEEVEEVDLEELLDEIEAERDAAADGDTGDEGAAEGDPADDDGAGADAAAGEDTEAEDPGEGGAAEEGPAAPDTSDIDPTELVIDPDADYLATIATSEGDIVLELDAAGAPVTVNNLVRLARAGYYDDVIFHRVIEGFVIQGGDPTGTGSGGPGYRFDDELGPAEELVAAEGGYPRGTLAMANAGPNTNGSQFFIVHGELVELPPAYTVFGQVTDGMDVVDAIATTPTSAGDRPVTDVTIETIEITGP